ncbi:uncharacterized protein METZ01_LOCUS238363 [marine metagenome]|uniref:Uncharacterized protein n=1 Tax=marine metagenome TaxID=408172 RepID=A0A382HEC3_9ZZZZ
MSLDRRNKGRRNIAVVRRPLQQRVAMASVLSTPLPTTTTPPARAGVTMAGG